MARIVVAKNSLPYPPRFGTDIVTFHLLRAMASRHQVTLVAAVRDDGWRRDESVWRELGIRLVPVLPPNRRSVLHRAFYKILNHVRAALTGTPLEFWYFNPPSFRAAVAAAAREADLVQFEYWYLSPTAKSVSAARKVLLKHDAEFNSNRREIEVANHPVARLRAWLRWRHRRSFEQEACRLFDDVLCLSAVDAELVAPFCRRTPRVVFPILPLPPEEQRCRGFSHRTLLYFGNIGRGANLQGLLRFVGSIYPRIRAAVPDVRLILRGDPPPPALRRAAADDPSIEFQPYGDDLAAVLGACTATIAPLWIGSGIKIKILSALGHGVPVITTPVGVEGIDVIHGEQILVATSDEAFASHTIAVLQQEELWQRLADGGREFARSAVSPDARREGVTELYQELADGS
jgi:glycosyltransferase involved in cell wall biosynthesis